MVARDLRLAIGSILIVREILKIAEYSRTIARYLIDFKPDTKNTQQLNNSFQLLNEMLDLIQILIDHYEKDLTARVLKLEKDINQNFLRAKQHMIRDIREAENDEKAIMLYSSLRQIKNLEKAGDRIISIQEILNFIRTGAFEDLEVESNNSL
jgi:phosphate transport system protein